MSHPYSRDAVLDFHDYLGEKGLIKPATAAARRAATSRVLGILSDEEASDVRNLNLDEVMSRFANKEGGKLTPESLSVYQGRLKNAIDDFLRYKENPLGFKSNVIRQKPGSTDRRRTNNATPEVTENLRKAPTAPVGTQSFEPEAAHIMPIPIRPDQVVRIHGLPYDLTRSEAKKIANVILALASED